jgi:predicted dehydrogenase
MEPVRSAIIGGGFIGHVHARAVLANAGRLVTVYDAKPEVSQALVSTLRADRVVASYESVLADADVNLVHVCTPNHLHFPMAMAAIDAGKHVICEKPLAVTSDEARALRDAADAAGVVAAVPFVYRFYASIRDARARVTGNELGDLRLLHGHYLQDWLLEESDNNWRVEPQLGGASRAFGDIGVHWCDLLEFVSGQRIARLNARAATTQRRKNAAGELVDVATEDLVSFIFETESGVVGNAVVSQVSAGRPNEVVLNIDGARSAISFNQMMPDSLWIGARAQNSIVWRGTSAASTAAQAYVNIPSGHPQGYQDAFNFFYRDVCLAIQGEKVDGLPTFEDGLRAAQLTEAVMKSAATRDWQEVPA